MDGYLTGTIHVPCLDLTVRLDNSMFWRDDGAVYDMTEHAIAVAREHNIYNYELKDMADSCLCMTITTYQKRNILRHAITFHINANGAETAFYDGLNAAYALFFFGKQEELFKMLEMDRFSFSSEEKRNEDFMAYAVAVCTAYRNNALQDINAPGLNQIINHILSHKV